MAACAQVIAAETVQAPDPEMRLAAGRDARAALTDLQTAMAEAHGKLDTYAAELHDRVQEALARTARIDAEIERDDAEWQSERRQHNTWSPGML